MARVTALKHYRKIDLQNLAEELEVGIEEGDTIAIIIQKITNSDSYDEDFALTQARYIVQDREENLARDKEREKRERELDIAKLESVEKERERELEKAKLESAEKEREGT